MNETTARSRLRTLLPAAAVACVVLLALGGAYVGGYQLRSVAIDSTISGEIGPIPVRQRLFHSDWERAAWGPMMTIESRLIGRAVESSVWVIEPPDLELTTVQTTVTVPDKATLLLGGSRLVFEESPHTGPFPETGEERDTAVIDESE